MSLTIGITKKISSAPSPTWQTLTFLSVASLKILNRDTNWVEIGSS